MLNNKNIFWHFITIFFRFLINTVVFQLLIMQLLLKVVLSRISLMLVALIFVPLLFCSFFFLFFVHLLVLLLCFTVVRRKIGQGEVEEKEEKNWWSEPNGFLCTNQQFFFSVVGAVIGEGNRIIGCSKWEYVCGF